MRCWVSVLTKLVPIPRELDCRERRRARVMETELRAVGTDQRLSVSDVHEDISRFPCIPSNTL